MRHAPLGGSCIEVSIVGLGTNTVGSRIELEQARRVVDAALAEGINFIDTANMYGRNAPGSNVQRGARGDSERLLGQILAGRRAQVVLATKFGNEMDDGEVARGQPEYARRCLEASLERLGTDYVDVLYYHRPDGITPLADTIGAMEEFLAEGTVRAIGCSNLTAEQLREVGGRISVLQNHLNLLRRDDAIEIVPLCAELGVGYVPYFPLASGLLTGKYRLGEPPPAGTRLADRPIDPADLERVAALEEIARRHGRSLVELAIGWLVSLPAVCSVIASATRPEQVHANAAAVMRELSPAELADLEAAA